VDANQLKLLSNPMDVHVPKKMGMCHDTTTPAGDSVCTECDSLPLNQESEKSRVSMESLGKTVNVDTSVKVVEMVKN